MNREPMEILISDDFANALDNLPREKQNQAEKTIRLLANNPLHPSLNPHRILSVEGVWECYVNKGDRILYDTEGGKLRLWQIGPHSIVDRVNPRAFAANTNFRRREKVAEPIAQSTLFEIPDAWMQAKQEEGSNPFANVPAAHLRVYGVPSLLVKAVQQAPTLDSLSQIDGLPTPTLEWLMDVATHPGVQFDPARLIFRTTLDRLEGYLEGKIKRLMLNLTPDQKRFVDLDTAGTILLKGCAGSGKTSVLIYRAYQLAAEGKRVLLLTYTKTLAAALQELLEELVGELPENLEVTYIDRWMMDFLESRGRRISVEHQRDVLRDHLQQTMSAVKAWYVSDVFNRGVTFFEDEINAVIKGNGLPSLLDYLQWQRHGRGKALQESARRAVWTVYEAYQIALEQAGKLDWNDLALLTLRELAAVPLDTPYDHVLIDETQDLTAAKLQVAARIAARSEDGQPSLFLVGDSSQTLYSRGFTWDAIGLKVQGHSFRIRRNFRSTRQIAEAATALLEHNKVSKSPLEMVDPAQSERHGPEPILLYATDESQAKSMVVERILSLVQDQTFRLSDFAILCPSNPMCKEFTEALKQKEIPCVYFKDEASLNLLENCVKVLTLHSAKGLEFPIVIIVGLKEGILPWSTKGRDPEEAALQLEQFRTQLYVGMTRAAEVLYLVASSVYQSRFVGEIRAKVRVEPATNVSNPSKFGI